MVAVLVGILGFLRLVPVVGVTVVYSIVAAVSRMFDRQNRFYHRLMRSWSRVMLALLGVRVVVEGIEHLQAGEPYLFLANHASYLDIVAIGAALPEGALFVYKEELTRVPIWGWSLRLSPFIRISRSDARNAMRSIEQGAAEIRQRGESVVIFPEGARSSDGVVGPFKRGGFLLAAKTGVPLVPLALKGASGLLPRGKLITRPGTITVEIGQPVTTGPDINRATERRLQQELEERLRTMVEAKTTT